eukprot:CAMPEP_0181337274 /NCGR_PEP_ID=MMETSP1101-20121128/27917_1 /TAXON_ID=46948 /ORGANISM="Rhodomonas abbreviata, Strain Caron Lab Isolate" /LENGTH=397 /DNA_ID=CAMNT_0023447729 /DNA_START=113 /DNA_END=1302 /DNA_ORIENTATION=-
MNIQLRQENFGREAWPESKGGEKSRTKPKGSFYEFRPREGRVNWRLIASLDPEAVERTGDVTALQAVIENLTFADVGGEGVRSLADANLVKLARLSQLCLEYLLHCQDVLETQRSKAVDDAARWQKEVSKARKTTKESEKKFAGLKKALKDSERARSTIEKIVTHLNTPGLAGGSHLELFKCHDGKVFVSRQHADSHIKRRYAEHEWPELTAQIECLPQPQFAAGDASHTIKDLALMASSGDATNKAASQQNLNAIEHMDKELRAQLVAMKAELDELQSGGLKEKLLRAEHALELEKERRKSAEELHNAEVLRLKEVMQEKLQQAKDELERERAEQRIAMKNLIPSSQVVTSAQLSRAGRMEDDDSDDEREYCGSTSGSRTMAPSSQKMLEELLKMS